MKNYTLNISTVGACLNWEATFRAHDDMDAAQRAVSELEVWKDNNLFTEATLTQEKRMVSVFVHNREEKTDV